MTLHIKRPSTISSQITQSLVTRFESFSRGLLNERLDIQADSGHRWSLFFCLGRLVWATGGLNPVRRWQRLVAQHCPQISPHPIYFREKDKFRCWDYHILTVLLKRQKITEEQAVAVIESSITEVLFDITQQAGLAALTSAINQQSVLDDPLTSIDVEKVLRQAHQDWESWRDAGLANESPNLVPVLRRPEQLRQHTSAAVYQNFVTLINGSYSLRDLAVQIKQDLVLLTRSLVPYIRKGLVELIEIDDSPLPASATPTAATSTPPLSASMGSSLVGYVEIAPKFIS